MRIIIIGAGKIGLNLAGYLSQEDNDVTLIDTNPDTIAEAVNAYDINEARADAIFQRMKDNSIAGSRLYMLWNDCCGRDTKLAMRIAQFASI